MKRRREKEMRETEIKAAIEELSVIQHPKQLQSSPPSPATTAGGASGDSRRREVSDIPTRPIIFLCSLILQVLDKIGPTMAVLRQDIFQNVQRLEVGLDSDPVTYSNVVEILKKEAAEGNARKRDSCSKALLWLTRALDMMVAVLERVVRDPNQSMEQVVEESYNLTLKPFHGWISSAAYKVALKLLPDKQTFIKLLVAKGDNLVTLKEEIQSLIMLLLPMLDEAHFVLVLRSRKSHVRRSDQSDES